MHAEKKKDRVVTGTRELTIRIVVKGAPPGVRFAVQRGKSDLLAPGRHDENEIVFDVPVRVSPRPGSRVPNLLGPYAQGPVSDRFLYVNSGTLAGQARTEWTRRAKIKTAALSWALVDEALSQGQGRLLAVIHGRAKDGGPCCGTVPLLGEGWAVFSGLE